MDEKIVRQYSVKMLADESGLTTARIRQILIEGRELRGYKVGRAWLIDKAEAERWLKEQKRDY